MAVAATAVASNGRGPSIVKSRRHVRAPSEPGTGKSTDFEEFANNLARMVEEGGKALAAYLKPREEGRIESDHAEFVDMVKTLGQVAEYWLADPQRDARAAVGARQGLSRPLGARRQAHGRRGRRAGRDSPIRATSASPIRNGRRTSSSISSSRPICSRANWPISWSRTPRGSTRTPGRRPSSTCARSPTRSRRRTSC